MWYRLPAPMTLPETPPESDSHQILITYRKGNYRSFVLPPRYYHLDPDWLAHGPWPRSWNPYQTFSRPLLPESVLRLLPPLMSPALLLSFQMFLLFCRHCTLSMQLQGLNQLLLIVFSFSQVILLLISNLSITPVIVN